MGRKEGRKEGNEGEVIKFKEKDKYLKETDAETEEEKE